MILEIVMLVMVVVSVLIALKARAEHKKRKSLSRPCKKCGMPTKRRAQMVPVTPEVERRFSRVYHPYVFNDCTNQLCRYAEFVPEKSVEKSFRLDKLAVRHICDPGQFSNDEDLFQRAGLIDIPQMSLEERVVSFRAHMDGAEIDHYRRALGIKLRCNS